MSESEVAGAGASPAVTRRMNVTRWGFLIILLLGGVVNYLDRGSLSIGNTTIAGEFHFNAVQMGLLLSAFSWPYAIANLPAGWLVDKFGPKKMFAWPAIAWSIVEALVSLAGTFGIIYTLRVLLGIAESPFFTAGLKVNLRWFNDKERAIPVSVINTGSQIGNAISPPLLVFLMLLVGWCGMFITVGILGVIVGLVWLRFYHDPTVQEMIAIHGSAEIKTSMQSKEKVSWGGLFKNPNMWFMIFGCFCIYYTVWVYITWLPSYLQTSLGFSLSQMGWVASLPYLCGVVGVMVGGWLANLLSKHGVSIVTSRRIPIIGGALLAAVVVLPAAFQTDVTVVITLLSVGYFAASIPNGCIWAIAADVAPSADLASSVGSIQNFGGYLGSALAPVVTGFILAATGNNYTPVFVVGGIMLIAGAIFYSLFRSSKQETVPQAA